MPIVRFSHSFTADCHFSFPKFNFELYHVVKATKQETVKLVKFNIAISDEIINPNINSHGYMNFLANEVSYYDMDI